MPKLELEESSKPIINHYVGQGTGRDSKRQLINCLSIECNLRSWDLPSTLEESNICFFTRNSIRPKKLLIN